uniref:PDZ domain-containing protein n=1 Tax=Guillardia theta TaxID=55529 RepID=A0A7S4UPZ8_GUITH
MSGTPRSPYESMSWSSPKSPMLQSFDAGSIQAKMDTFCMVQKETVMIEELERLNQVVFEGISTLYKSPQKDDASTFGVRIGLETQDCKPTQVKCVLPGSWAFEKGEILFGDEITAVDNRPVDENNILQNMMGNGAIGSKSIISLKRNGIVKKATLVRTSQNRVDKIEEIFNMVKEIKDVLRQDDYQHLLPCLEIILHNVQNLELSSLEDRAQTLQEFSSLQVNVDATVASLIEMIRVIQDEKHQMRNWLEAIRQEHDSSKDKLNSLETKMEMGKRGSESIKSHFEDLRRELSNVREENLLLKQEISSWKGKMEAKDGMLDQKNLEIQEIKKSMVANAEMITKNHQSTDAFKLATYLEKVATVKPQGLLEKLQTTKVTGDDINKILDIAILQNHLDVEDIIAASFAFSDTSSPTIVRMKNLYNQGRLESLQHVIQDLDSQLSRCMDEIILMRRRVENLEDCTKDAVVEMAEDITNLTRQVEDFCNDLQVQQSRNTSLAEKLKITKDMIKTMIPKTDYYQLLEEKNAAKETLRQNEMTIGDQDNEIRDLKQRIKMKDNEIEGLKYKQMELASQDKKQPVKQVLSEEEYVTLMTTLKESTDIQVIEFCQIMDCILRKERLNATDLCMLLERIDRERSPLHIYSLLSVLDGPPSRSIDEVKVIIQELNDGTGLSLGTLQRILSKLRFSFPDPQKLERWLEQSEENLERCPIPSDHDEMNDMRRQLRELQKKISQDESPSSPVIAPPGGSFQTDHMHVVLASATPNTVIYYCTDDRELSLSNYEQAGASPIRITLRSSCRLKAFCLSHGGISETVSETFYLQE